MTIVSIASWTWFTSIDIAIRVHVCHPLASIDAISFVILSPWSIFQIQNPKQKFMTAASWTWFTSIDIAIRVHVCQSLASIDAIYFVFSSMWSKGMRLFLHLKRSWQWSLETRNWLRERSHYSWKCFAWPEAFFLECLREAKPFFYILNDVLQCEFFPFDLRPSRSNSFHRMASQREAILFAKEPHSFRNYFAKQAHSRRRRRRRRRRKRGDRKSVV